MITDLEGQIRDELARQAAALTPPKVEPDGLVLRDDPGKPTVTANQGEGAGGSSTTTPPVVGAAFSFNTPQVRLNADELTVEAGGRTFTPAADVTVHGDPGRWNEYTTLELTWLEHDVEMRINLYFASDGTDWWVSEVRTYDGATEGKWIESVGERFRSRLGTAYEGDVDLGGLHIRGMHLEAFRTPEACSGASGPMALVSGYASIDLTVSVQDAGRSPSGFGYTALLIDTATCEPIEIDGLELEASVADPSVGPLSVDVPAGSDLAVDLSLDEQTPLVPGETTLHLTARSGATGEIIDELDVPVVVRSS